EGLEAVGGGLRREAVFAQDLAERRASVRFVVDDEDSTAMGHGDGFCRLSFKLGPLARSCPIVTCTSGTRKPAGAGLELGAKPQVLAVTGPSVPKNRSDLVIQS